MLLRNILLAVFIASADAQCQTETIATDLSMKSATVKSNTLRDGKDGTIRYGNVGKVNNQIVDLVVTSLRDSTEYNNFDPISGDFGRIGMQPKRNNPGAAHGRYELCLVKPGTHAGDQANRVIADSFTWTVYDIDRRGTEGDTNANYIREKLVIDTEKMDHYEFFNTPDPALIDVFCNGDNKSPPCTTSNTVFEAASWGNEDNPKVFDNLTNRQKRRSVKFVFKYQACWTFTYQMFCPADFCEYYPAGNFLFSLDAKFATAKTCLPSPSPSTTPSRSSTGGPTISSSAIPSRSPTATPTTSPSATPSRGPTVPPTILPSTSPSVGPTTATTNSPSANPSSGSTSGPTTSPSTSPSRGPTGGPSASMSRGPTSGATISPSVSSSDGPSGGQTTPPSASPSHGSTSGPTTSRSETPSRSSIGGPTISPSAGPIVTPSVEPSMMPSVGPSVAESNTPTMNLSTRPTITSSLGPTMLPSMGPTFTASVGPTMIAPGEPTMMPSTGPTIPTSDDPTMMPSSGPTVSAPDEPTMMPFAGPTVTVSIEPSVMPLAGPTVTASDEPSMTPSMEPTVTSSEEPTMTPSEEPTEIIEIETNPVCKSDIILLDTHGVTAYPPNDVDVFPAISIVSQDRSTVTVALNQAWETPSIDKYFYEYKTNRFDYRCFESESVEADEVIDTITMQCNGNSPFALLKICLQDVSGSFLDAGDNGTVGKCCHSDAPENTPTVCYHVEIKCETGCLEDDGSKTRYLRAHR